MSFQSMKNKILSKTRFLFFLILLLPQISRAQSFAYKTMLSGLYDSDFPVLKPDQIQDLGSFQVLDAREKHEYEVSHLAQAKWVGYDTFSLQNLTSLEKNKPVLIYCTVGARSQEIGKKLKAAGFSQVYNLYGGIIHWANEGRPVYHQGKITNRIHTYSQPWGIWLKKGEKVY
mgnify:CR=1 FL=1